MMQNYLCTICKHPNIEKRFGVIDRMIIRFYIKITINQLEQDCLSLLKNGVADLSDVRFFSAPISVINTCQ